MSTSRCHSMPTMTACSPASANPSGTMTKPSAAAYQTTALWRSTAVKTKPVAHGPAAPPPVMTTNMPAMKDTEAGVPIAGLVSRRCGENVRRRTAAQRTPTIARRRCRRWRCCPSRQLKIVDLGDQSASAILDEYLTVVREWAQRDGLRPQSVVCTLAWTATDLVRTMKILATSGRPATGTRAARLPWRRLILIHDRPRPPDRRTTLDSTLYQTALRHASPLRRSAPDVALIAA